MPCVVDFCQPGGRNDRHMNGFLIRCGVTGLAVLLASQIIPGIEIHGFAAGVVAVIVLSLLNAMVRPLLYLLSAPFIVLTLGLFTIVINAGMLWLTSQISSSSYVSGPRAALMGALTISVVSWVLSVVTPDGKKDKD